ncbi:MAG: ABC transporter substrate-binding protein [Xanthobacteraceae bacterium]|nr:ABC transporter substrate-binding protein [Xanthobacteraceae bacterium]
MRTKTLGIVLAASLGFAGAVQAQELFVGILNDNTGPTALVGAEMAAAKQDTLDWINANGGINGKKIQYEAIDYAYKAPAAIAAYKKWMSRGVPPLAVLGYGTADTEALSNFINQDKVIYLSHSFSAKLTDPAGKSGAVERPTPFNFFHGPSYSDGCRAVLTWAMEDWKSKGGKSKPKFAYTGDNHPFANSPRAACLKHAEELGFEIVPAIQYSMRPGDFKAQCITLRETGAEYTYLGNTGDSNVAMLRSCASVGVKTRFMTNIYGYSEIEMKAAGDAANGVIVPLHIKWWNADAPGAKLLHQISKGVQRSTFYTASVCSVMYLKEAMEWADKNGGINAENVQKGMYQKKDWVPAGLEGLCAPATWTAEDHRSVTQISVSEGVIAGDKYSWRVLREVNVGREARWWGQ